MPLQDILYYLVGAGLFFVMIRYGCGAHIMGRGHHHAKSGQDLGPAMPRLSGPVTDPVCGMSVPGNSAKTAVYQGEVYYFCSQTCREKFEASPQTYANSNSSPPRKGGAHACC